MPTGKFTYEYPRPAVTVDCVIFGFDDSELKTLLVERSIEPHKGAWALPGGFIGMDEDAEQCAKRILKKETCLENVFMEQLYTFSAINRDPRYRVISIAYVALVNISKFKIEAGQDTHSVEWIPVSKTPPLAFDHKQIIDKALERLKGKIMYQPVGFELLPHKFTMPDLQRLYETVLQVSMDRRNFRKKILSYNLLTDTGEQMSGAKARAPKLYCFDKQKYEELTAKGFYFEL